MSINFRKATTFLAAIGALSVAWVAYGQEQAKTKLTVGYLPVTGHAKFFVAKDEGFFEKEGLDVELAEFANSADGLAALRAGKLDIGAFGTTAPLVHVAKGGDIRIIGGVMGEDAALVTNEENASKIKTIPDLKGKKVATVRLATGDAVLRGAIEKAGLDWKKDLQIFELKNPPAVIEAVKTGQVDAGLVWGPHDFRAEEQGLKVVIRSRFLQPGHPCCRLTVLGADADKRPEVWVKFIRAFLKAQEFTLLNHEKTVADIAKHIKLDPALIDKAYYHGFLDQTSDPNKKGVEIFWETMKSSGFVESNEDIDKHIDGKLYKQALDSLAKEEPSNALWPELEKQFAERN